MNSHLFGWLWGYFDFVYSAFETRRAEYMIASNHSVSRAVFVSLGSANRSSSLFLPRFLSENRVHL